MVFKSFVLIVFWFAVRTKEVPSPFYTIQWQKPKMTSENVSGFSESPMTGPAFRALVAAEAYMCHCSWRAHACKRGKKEPKQ